MPEPNTVDDLVLTDPSAMDALADPARLALLDRLRREGPATAAALAAHLQTAGPALEADLRELESFGLVARNEEVLASGEARWEAVGKGFVFEIPEDPAGQAAARRLSNVMLLNYADLPRHWVADDEPRLELEWARAAGLFNARVTLTADELRGVQDALERLLEPYITREAGDLPAEAGPARVLCYFMPEAAASGTPAG